MQVQTVWVVECVGFYSPPSIRRYDVVRRTHRNLWLATGQRESIRKGMRVFESQQEAEAFALAKINESVDELRDVINELDAKRSRLAARRDN